MVAVAGLIAVGCRSNDRAETIVAPPTAPPGDAPPGMVWVPGGEFVMGGDDQYAGEGEQPVHRVQVDGFFMDAHTVTNARFREFVRATGYVTIAEQTPDVAELMRQLPPGTPPPGAASSCVCQARNRCRAPPRAARTISMRVRARRRVR